MFNIRKFEKSEVSEGSVVIDVRTPEEYLTEHASGSINIPLANLENKILELGYAKDGKIILVCRSGARAEAALNIFKNHGFINVENKGSYLNVK